MGNTSSTESAKEIEEALKNNDQDLANRLIQERMEMEDKVCVDIAVTGETGSGKSSFVNAFRSVDESDENAAPTDCIETTMKVTPYPHPKFPNLTLWDLPGIGTTDFPAAKYLKIVDFKRFDSFIIVSASRFRENDVKLAKEIKKMKKSFYYVRSKTDVDLSNEEKKKKENFNETETLDRIKNNCTENLKRLGVESPQVFLVSSFDLRLYDFNLLQQTLEKDLPELKRKVLLFSVPNVSLDVIRRKKESLKNKTIGVALVSASVAGVPVPGLSVAVDAALLVGTITKYVFTFGLDIKSLRRLADKTGVSYEDLKAEIISPLVGVEITPALLIQVLSRVPFAAAVIASTAVEEATKLTLILIPVSMALSFITTYKILTWILDVLAEDAERIFRKIQK